MSKTAKKTIALTIEQLQKAGQIIYALIYGRVSSKKQEKEGHGKEAQVHRCSEHANRKKYVIKDEAIFTDTATGGGDISNRQGQGALLKYIDKFPHRNFVLIVDDPSRLSRDVKAHFSLREALRNRGVAIESPNYTFGDTPEDELHEGMTVLSNQYFRKSNRRTVIQKMKARLEIGYYCFSKKKGYDVLKDPLRGKIAVPNNEGLKMLKPAIKAFACGELPRKIDFVRYLIDKGFWKGYPETLLDRATNILTDCFYAGYIEYLPWEVSRRKGYHEPLISLAEFERIQSRLNKNSVPTRTRRDIRDDLPARGFVKCICDAHMTAAWSKGRHGKYAYYFCTNRACSLYKKSVPAKLVEDGFTKILKSTKLKDDVGKVIDAIYERVWKEEIKELENKETHTIREINELNDRTRELTDLVRKAKTDTLRGVYEKQIEETAFELERLRGHTAKGTDLLIPYRTALAKSKQLIKSPYSVWKKMELEERHELFFFIFDEKLVYDKENGYRTADLPTAAKLFEDFVLANNHNVDHSGLEPLTSPMPWVRSTR